MLLNVGKLSAFLHRSAQPHDFRHHNHPHIYHHRHRFYVISRASRSETNTATPRSSQHVMLDAAQKLSQRLQLGIIAESEERERQMLSVYSKVPERQLIRDGLILVSLTASAQGRLYDELIFKLESSRPLPNDHKFKPGTTIYIEPTLRNNSNSPSFSIEATVFDAFSTHILVTLPPTQRHNSTNDNDRSERYSNNSSDTALLLAAKPNSLHVRLRAQDSTTKRQLSSLEKLIDFSNLGSNGNNKNSSSRGEALVRAIILGSQKSSDLAAETPEWMNDALLQQHARKALQDIKDLNPSQKTAIAAALTRTFTMWQGPPGTGKTRTALAYLKVVCTMLKSSSMSSSRGQQRRLFPILAVAETNNAADNLLEGLHAAGIAVVRIGQPVRIRPSLRMCSLEHLAENSPSGQQAAFLRDSATNMLMKTDKAWQEKKIDRRQVDESQREARRLWNQAREQLLEAEQDVLRSCEVVVATCSGAGDARLAGWKFPLVVIDESTQATEAATLVPLVLGAESVVMAGDPAQLWPVVVSQKAKESGLDVPLFARLQQQCNMPALLLNTQYRMHPKLSKFSSIAFYKGKIVNGVTEQDRPMIALSSSSSPLSISNSPLVFVNISGKERQAGVGAAALLAGDNASYSNPEQATAALEIVQHVLQDVSVKSCALLTPYNGQVKLLTSMIKKKGMSSLSDDDNDDNNSVDSTLLLPQQAIDSGRLVISTIDGFQGREADCVVLSTVRCNTRGNLGFVTDNRRMNVALTRARRAMIVLGCKQTLQTNEYWMAWLKLAQHIDYYC